MANINSIAAIEIKTSILFDLEYAINTIFTTSFLLFLIIDLYLLIPAAIAKIFNLTAELRTPIGLQSKKAKAEIGIDPVIAEV